MEKVTQSVSFCVCVLLLSSLVVVVFDMFIAIGRKRLTHNKQIKFVMRTGLQNKYRDAYGERRYYGDIFPYADTLQLNVNRMIMNKYFRLGCKLSVHMPVTVFWAKRFRFYHPPF